MCAPACLGRITRYSEKAGPGVSNAKAGLADSSRETAFEDLSICCWRAIRIAAQYAMLFAVRTTRPQILYPVRRVRQQQRHGWLK
jgi:hypothetical protein